MTQPKLTANQQHELRKLLRGWPVGKWKEETRGRETEIRGSSGFYGPAADDEH